MADEIRYTTSTAGLQLYAILRQLKASTGYQVWNGSALVAYVPADRDDYKLALDGVAGGYAADFPAAAPAGVYAIAIYAPSNEAGRPDHYLRGDVINWTGTAVAQPAAPTDRTAPTTGKVISIEGPAFEVVTQQEIASHLRIGTHESQLSTMPEMIAAAVDYAEESMEMTLAARTLMASFYDDEPLILPRGPIIDVYSVIGHGEVFASAYTLRHVGRQTELRLGQNLQYPIRVVYRAGYADRAQIPPTIKLAIMMHTGSLFENPLSVTEKAKTPVPHSLDAFYRRKSRGTGIG